MLKLYNISKFIVIFISINIFLYNTSTFSKETVYLTYKEFIKKFPNGYPKFIGIGNPKSIGAFKMYLNEHGYTTSDYKGNSIGFKYYISDIEGVTGSSNSETNKSNKIIQNKKKFYKSNNSVISDNSKSYDVTENISKWVGAINLEIEKIIRYPKKAKDRNQSGRLLINISLKTNGKLLNVGVESSSGFKTLDQSAVNSINKIKKFSSAPFEAKNKIFTFILPIKYSLVN